MTVRVVRRVIATVCALIACSGLDFLAPSAAAVTRTEAPLSAKITPGSLMITDVDATTTTACTAGFVFRNDRATFLGYAAHCAIPTQPKHETGCEYETLPLGTRVSIRGLNGGRAEGRLAYDAWRTMRDVGETDDNRCRYNDFALVEIDRSDVGSIDPTVPEVGGPTGLETTPPEQFDAVVSYQPYVTQPALKQGISLGPRSGGWSHRIDVSPSASFGDSGSGLLDAHGAAFGILATHYLDQLATSGVTDLRLAMAYAERYGRVGHLELVPGAQPFHAVGGGWCDGTRQSRPGGHEAGTCQAAHEVARR